MITKVDLKQIIKQSTRRFAVLVGDHCIYATELADVVRSMDSKLAEKFDAIDKAYAELYTYIEFRKDEK